MREAISPAIGAYYLEQVLKKNSALLAARCGEAASRTLINRLTQALGSAEEDSYSYIWRAAIEERNYTHGEIRDILLDALRDVLLQLCVASPSDARNVV